MMSASYQCRQGAGLIVNVSVNRRTAGTVVVVGGRYAMARAQFLEVAVADDVTLFRRVSAVVNGPLVIYFGTDIVYSAQLDNVIVSMQQNGHTGCIEYVALADSVAHSVYPDARLVGFLYQVEIMDEAVFYKIACRSQGSTVASAHADTA